MEWLTDMFCWHKWSKWVDIGPIVVVDTQQVVAKAQERRCLKCNMLDTRRASVV